HQPAWTFGNPAPQRQHAEPQNPAEPKRNPPAQLWRDQAWIERNQRATSPDCSADPERAVHHQIGKAALPRGDEFLDRRIHRRILATDASPGKSTKHSKGGKAPSEPGGQGRGE